MTPSKPSPEEARRIIPPSFKPFLLKKAPQAPELRIRTHIGFLGRLRSLRKKDIAWIVVGLAFLLAAPLSEQFLRSPGEELGLQQGFDRKGPLFPESEQLYESGTGGFSPGALLGQEPDIITPLNVRDPSALVLSPEMEERLPVASESAPADSWSDALDAAKQGAKEAAKKAPLPKAPEKLAGALRGLSAITGSSPGPQVQLPPLSPVHAPNRSKESRALTRSQAVPGFQGAALRGLASGSPESWKSAGSRQADLFNRPDPTRNLETAASQVSPHAVSGAGNSSGKISPGEENKNPAPNRSKDGKSLGESLEFLRAKLEMEKDLDLKYKKKEWNELGRQKLLQELILKTAVENLLGKGLFEPIGRQIASVISGELPKKKSQAHSTGFSSNPNGTQTQTPPREASVPIGIAAGDMGNLLAGLAKNTKGLRRDLEGQRKRLKNYAARQPGLAQGQWREKMDGHIQGLLAALSDLEIAHKAAAQAMEEVRRGSQCMGRGLLRLEQAYEHAAEFLEETRFGRSPDRMRAYAESSAQKIEEASSHFSQASAFFYRAEGHGGSLSGDGGNEAGKALEEAHEKLARAERALPNLGAFQGRSRSAAEQGAVTSQVLQALEGIRTDYAICQQAVERARAMVQKALSANAFARELSEQSRRFVSLTQIGEGALFRALYEKVRQGSSSDLEPVWAEAQENFHAQQDRFYSLSRHVGPEEG